MTDIPDDEKVHFAVVVDGDVAYTEIVWARAENMVAALMSNPKIIPVPNELRGLVGEGWTFDGTKFVAPEVQE